MLATQTSADGSARIAAVGNEAGGMEMRRPLKALRSLTSFITTAVLVVQSFPHVPSVVSIASELDHSSSTAVVVVVVVVFTTPPTIGWSYCLHCTDHDPSTIIVSTAVLYVPYCTVVSVRSTAVL